MLDDALQGKIFKGLVIGLAVIVIAILLKEVILKPRILVVPEMLPYTVEIKIDFEFLKNKKLEELSPFEQIAVPTKFGRDYPFSAY